VRRVRIDLSTPPTDSEASALCVTLRRSATLADLRAADLPEWWRDAIVDRDDDDEPSGRATYVACLLVVATAFVAGFASVEFDDDLVATIIVAAEFGLALETLRGDAIIGAYSGDGLGPLLAAFVEANSVAV